MYFSSCVHSYVLQRTVWQVCNKTTVRLLSILGSQLGVQEEGYHGGDHKLWCGHHQPAGCFVWCVSITVSYFHKQWSKMINCVGLRIVNRVVVFSVCSNANFPSVSAGGGNGTVLQFLSGHIKRPGIWWIFLPKVSCQTRVRTGAETCGRLRCVF